MILSAQNLIMSTSSNFSLQWESSKGSAHTARKPLGVDPNWGQPTEMYWWQPIWDHMILYIEHKYIMYISQNIWHIWYLLQNNFVHEKIIVGHNQNSLFSRSVIFWENNKNFLSCHCYTAWRRKHLLSSFVTGGPQALDKPWWRYIMEIWMVLVLFVGSNGKEQLLQPNCFRCCRVWGMDED